MLENPGTAMLKLPNTMHCTFTPQAPPSPKASNALRSTLPHSSLPEQASAIDYAHNGLRVATVTNDFTTLQMFIQRGEGSS